MINFLNEECWQYEMPWGSVINPDLVGKEIAITGKLVNFNKNYLTFRTKKGNFQAYKRDKNWNVICGTYEWGVGSCIAKNEFRTHFGKYLFKFKLPNYRGSWPAIWLIDLHHETNGGMGMPPEIDIMEHFRKDSFLTRFHHTATYHGGFTYENDVEIVKKLRKCWGFWPVDLQEVEIEFLWNEKEMVWIVDGKEKLRIPNTVQKYPLKPMNLIIGTGIGLDWKPIESDEPFIVTKAEYYPLVK